MKSRTVLLCACLFASYSWSAHAQTPAEPTPHDASLGRDGQPLAGYHGGLFYLRDESDDYRLYLQGRAHIDF